MNHNDQTAVTSDPFKRLPWSSAVDALTGVLHMSVFRHHPNGTAAAIEAEKKEHERERHRIWYVAATRARELLVLPRPSCGIKANWWVGMVEAGVRAVVALEPQAEAAVPAVADDDLPPGPDAVTFAAQGAAIRANARLIKRRTPHLAEGNEASAEIQRVMPVEGAGDDMAVPVVRGSRERGLVLHKLIEEVLTGETDEDEQALAGRASVLLRELDVAVGAHEDPAEMARSVVRGLAVIEVAAVRGRLMPEVSVLASATRDGLEEITFGVADAVALDGEGRPELVIDWKSDVAPTPATIADYRDQVGSYLDATGTKMGLIVFLSSGSVVHVKR